MDTKHEGCGAAHDSARTGDAPCAPCDVDAGHARKGLAGATMLAALGVVYGDIGTSPLYTLKECFGHAVGLPLTEANVLGILSMVTWSLLLVVTIKYVGFIMCADNKGEGGILAIMALALRKSDPARYPRALLLTCGMFGAALFFGDSLITPAISVLSAVEGVGVIAPTLHEYVVPLALLIIVALFMVQRHGTARIGVLFGPVMLAWFATLAVLGVLQIVQNPSVLRAADPGYALAFAASNPWLAFVALGSVVLAVTGGEALYVDMGHFGKLPIRVVWLGFVLPALLLNYYGQGALLLADANALENPFYHLAPDWAQVPLLLLATCATVIASQAVISGCYSLSQQAVQLGLIPRLRILHTSEQEKGQIYIPRINWTLMVLVLALVVGFQSSSNLAAAYGIAVTGEMAMTSVLAFVVARTLWNWPLPLAAAFLAVFLSVDLAFFGSNLLKVPQGGWFPLLVGAIGFGVMATWKRGRRVVQERLAAQGMDLTLFTDRLTVAPKTRVSGTAIYLARESGQVPYALLHNLKHNKVLHDRVILLTVSYDEVPRVPKKDRVALAERGHGFFAVTLRFGFMEEPNIPKALRLLRYHGMAINPTDTSFFLGRETLLASDQPDLPPWQERLFIFMQSNASSAAEFFHIPPDRVIELGTQIKV